MKLIAPLLLSLILLQASFAAKPNVLFIAVDDMRPELGCYGNKIIKTPNIDRLAARGLVFNHAYVQQAVCSPSRTAMLTGLRPDKTRVWDLVTHFRVAQPDCVTLPQHFKQNGYHCAGMGKIFHIGLEDGRSWSVPHWYPKGKSVDTDPVDWTKKINTPHNVDREEYANAVSPEDNDKRAEKGKEGKSGPAFEVSPKSDDDLPDGATAAEAVKRLHELKGKTEPFFLAVGFLKPHLPFVSPKKYWDMYDPATIPVPAFNHLPSGSPEFAGHQNSELHNYIGVPKGNPIPAEFARTLRHGYYAAISFTDTQIGRVLDALEKEGLAENTIIVLWGDHGWQLGEHGLWEKHTNFEIAAHAPLIISVPQQKSAGQKCDAQVEFVDVYPTLADLCGLPAPTKVDGSSLKPFIENPTAPAMKIAMSQYPRSAGKDGQVMGYSVRNERYRCTFWRERYGSKIIATELFDELNDPDETVSLADKPEHKELIASLAKNLPPVVEKIDSEPTKGKTKKKSKKPEAKPETTTKTTDTEERGPKFDRLDKDKAGKITREYYTTHQSDAEAAAKRFELWDANKDGFLSREEYVTQGGKHPQAK
ncbi:MAG: sulfatase-like hydrolase/transferase [Verrucomicrobiaceae bacterium]|nr:sulfatase-like hydrolase/transferase [Verrucomicrobiaceae bacterium]